MYIDLKTRLFKEDPCNRFATFFKCHPDVWRKLWYRYKILEYTKGEAREYLTIILKIPISKIRFERWIDRTEIYLKAQEHLNKGEHVIPSETFGRYKKFAEVETTKNK